MVAKRGLPAPRPGFESQVRNTFMHLVDLPHLQTHPLAGLGPRPVGRAGQLGRRRDPAPRQGGRRAEASEGGQAGRDGAGTASVGGAAGGAPRAAGRPEPTPRPPRRDAPAGLDGVIAARLRPARAGSRGHLRTLVLKMQAAPAWPPRVGPTALASGSLPVRIHPRGYAGDGAPPAGAGRSRAAMAAAPRARAASSASGSSPSISGGPPAWGSSRSSSVSSAFALPLPGVATTPTAARRGARRPARSRSSAASRGRAHGRRGRPGRPGPAPRRRRPAPPASAARATAGGRAARRRARPAPARPGAIGSTHPAFPAFASGSVPSVHRRAALPLIFNPDRANRPCQPAESGATIYYLTRVSTLFF